jgi:hypothetical protein
MSGCTLGKRPAGPSSGCSPRWLTARPTRERLASAVLPAGENDTAEDADRLAAGRAPAGAAGGRDRAGPARPLNRSAARSRDYIDRGVPSGCCPGRWCMWTALKKWSPADPVLSQPGVSGEVSPYRSRSQPGGSPDRQPPARRQGLDRRGRRNRSRRAGTLRGQPRRRTDHPGACAGSRVSGAIRATAPVQLVR